MYSPYDDRYATIDSAAKRKNATRETTNTLKAWLFEHRKNPYPTKGEKIMLAIITKMTLTQVSTWFANARRRLKKENKMTWEPRNKAGDDQNADDKSSFTSEDRPISSTLPEDEVTNKAAKVTTNRSTVLSESIVKNEPSESESNYDKENQVGLSVKTASFTSSDKYSQGKWTFEYI